jgi:DHA1 family bicyclomycin/chloramphenicol resistance-like MFS transporter
MTTRHGPLIANLLAQICFGLLAMTLCLPSMQEWAVILDSSQSLVQLTFSLYVVAYGGFQILFGPLSDHYGRRRVLMIGLTIAMVGALVSALANDITVLVLGPAWWWGARWCKTCSAAPSAPV